MNRHEFSKMLVDVRKESECSINELARRTGMMFQQVQFIEIARYNYNVLNVVRYLRSLKKLLVLSYNGRTVNAESYGAIPEFIKEVRNAESLSQAQLAKEAKFSKSQLFNIENVKSIMHIETLLTIADILHIQIEIK